jgi:hypothetical protein
VSHPRPLLDRVSTSVALVAATVLGLSAGAMLAEGVVLVPYWRALPPRDFLDWFGANEPRLFAFYGPLEIAGAVLTMVAAGLCAVRRRPGRGLLAVAGALAAAVLVTYALYFGDANASFAAGSIALDDVGSELGRWAAWQWVRIALGAGAFVAALLAVRREGG